MLYVVSSAELPQIATLEQLLVETRNEAYAGIAKCKQLKNSWRRYIVKVGTLYLCRIQTMLNYGKTLLKYRTAGSSM